MRRWVVAEAAASEEGTCARPAALWEFVPSMYASMLHDKSQLPCLWESHMPPRQPLPSAEDRWPWQSTVKVLPSIKYTHRSSPGW